LNRSRIRVTQGARHIEPAIASLLLCADWIGGAGQAADDYAVTQTWVNSMHECSCSSYYSGSRRGSADSRVGTIQAGGQQIHAGGSQEDELTIVAAGDQRIVGVSSRDADHTTVAGRISYCV
jgi:hypothetical protein